MKSPKKGKSWPVVWRSHRWMAALRLVSGADIYRDLLTSKRTRLSLELATRLIALQPKAFEELPKHLHYSGNQVFCVCISDINTSEEITTTKGESIEYRLQPAGLGARALPAEAQ